MVGGYSMIDFSGVDLGELGSKTGIYKAVKSALATDKPLVLYGLVNGDQAFSPIVAFGGEENATSVFVSFFPVTLHISNADVITM